LSHLPKQPKHRKAAFYPSAVSLTYIMRPDVGWQRGRESESYLRGVSGVCPGSVRWVLRDLAIRQWAGLSPRRPGWRL